jgi:hypothetical protein
MKNYLIEELGYEVIKDDFWGGKPTIFRKHIK